MVPTINRPGIAFLLEGEPKPTAGTPDEGVAVENEAKGLLSLEAHIADWDRSNHDLFDTIFLLREGSALLLVRSDKYISHPASEKMGTPPAKS